MGGAADAATRLAKSREVRGAIDLRDTELESRPWVAAGCDLGRGIDFRDDKIRVARVAPGYPRRSELVQDGVLGGITSGARTGELLGQSQQQHSQTDAVANDNYAVLLGLDHAGGEEGSEVRLQEGTAPRLERLHCLGTRLLWSVLGGCRRKLDALPVAKMLLSKLGQLDDGQRRLVRLVLRVAYGVGRLGRSAQVGREDVPDVQLGRGQARRQSLGLQGTVSGQAGVARAAVEAGCIVDAFAMTDEKKVHWPRDEAYNESMRHGMFGARGRRRMVNCDGRDILLTR